MQLDLDIHNYYEHLIVEHLECNNYSNSYDKEFLADLCCLALTKLPARYIRHDIDMAFFLDADERNKMTKEVTVAIDTAKNYLLKRA